jgi:hypothetical protein
MQYCFLSYPFKDPRYWYSKEAACRTVPESYRGTLDEPNKW